MACAWSPTFSFIWISVIFNRGGLNTRNIFSECSTSGEGAWYKEKEAEKLFLQVLLNLEEYLPYLVIVGGWVPFLAFTFFPLAVTFAFCPALSGPIFDAQARDLLKVPIAGHQHRSRCSRHGSQPEVVFIQGRSLDFGLSLDARVVVSCGFRHRQAWKLDKPVGGFCFEVLSPLSLR
jgi:hypothetical protein